MSNQRAHDVKPTSNFMGLAAGAIAVRHQRLVLAQGDPRAKNRRQHKPAPLTRSSKST